MSITSEISRIQQAKADIKTAIEAKGVIVPSSATIDTYDEYVSQISGGGGSYEIRYISGSTYCDGSDLVVDVTKQISVDSGSTWITSGSPYVVIVESGSSQCQTGDVGFICYGSNGSVLVSGDCSSLDNYAINRNIITEYGAVSSYDIYAVDIGACVTTIASQTFKNDNGNMPATSITFDQGSQLTTIESYAFKDIKGITSISLPNSLTTLGDFAFSYADNIAGVFTIPANVTSIGTYCFEGLTKVSYFEILATTPPAIGNAPFIGTNCPIYVPCESVELYKQASGWASYSSRITCIPTPTYQWVSYESGDTVPTATTVYGVKLYENYDEGYNVIFSGTTGDYIKFHPNGNFGQWAAEDENGTSIDISSYYQAGSMMYTIVFSDLGLGGMNIISPTTIFKDDIDLYVTN